MSNTELFSEFDLWFTIDSLEEALEKVNLSYYKIHLLRIKMFSKLALSQDQDMQFNRLATMKWLLDEFKPIEGETPMEYAQRIEVAYNSQIEN